MKTTIGALVLAIILILLAVLFSNSNFRGAAAPENANNVSIVDGKQIIEISAKGGYTPRVSSAKAGIPTIIRVDTNGTFDCSSSVAIPSLNYRKSLPMTGTTDIDIPVQKAGTKIQGLCAMGMYNFVINFN